MREISRKKPIIANQVPEHVERAVIELAIENSALGQLRASQELLQRGIVVSPGSVGSIWLRHDLETMLKRLKALNIAALWSNIVINSIWSWKTLITLQPGQTAPKQTAFASVSTAP